MLFLLCLAIVGCAPREAYFRPTDGKAVGRDGLVGVRVRVPPDAADAEAVAAVALSPMTRQGGAARLTAIIEFRNKRQGTITFLPPSLRLSGPGLEAARPVSVTRGGRSATDSERIGPWSEAGFVARFELPAEPALAAGTLALGWSFRYEGQDYALLTRFAATDGKLAERSREGWAPGLEKASASSRESGVPFLMDVPFLGFFFRSGTHRATHSDLDLGAAPGGPAGAWWDLEP